MPLEKWIFSRDISSQKTYRELLQILDCSVVQSDIYSIKAKFLTRTLWFAFFGEQQYQLTILTLFYS